MSECLFGDAGGKLDDGAYRMKVKKNKIKIP